MYYKKLLNCKIINKDFLYFIERNTIFCKFLVAISLMYIIKINIYIGITYQNLIISYQF